MDSTVSSGFKFEEGKKETTSMHLWPSGISVGSRGYNESRHKLFPVTDFINLFSDHENGTVLLCTVSRRTSLRINNTLPTPLKRGGQLNIHLRVMLALVVLKRLRWQGANPGWVGGHRAGEPPKAVCQC